jgi:SAM-dependent methyltransferase
MAHTDVNGLLRCGQMFLASTEQMRILLQQSIPDSIRGRPGVEWPWSVPQQADQQRRPSRLLDVGAGDGHITAQLAGFFDEVVTTEVAARMVPRLRAQGWTCAHTADLDEGLPIGGDIAQDGFDCVALFNVLDRCSRPRTLLRQIRERMRKPVPHPSGSGELLNTSRLLLSVPLPLDPSVEVGTRWVDPEERILAAGTARACRDFESASLALADFFVEQGFHVETLSRIPYLSQGDTRRPFYVLDCSLWLLSVRQPGEPKPKDDQPAAAAAAAAAGSGAHHEDHAAHAAPSALSATLNDFTSQVD